MFDYLKNIFLPHRTSVPDKNPQVSGKKFTDNHQELVKKEYDYLKVHKLLMRNVHQNKLIIPAEIDEITRDVLSERVCREMGDENKVAKIKSIVVSGTVKKVGNNAFATCKSLEEVIIEEGVESLGSSVFYGCKNLKLVQLPSSLKEVDGWTFKGCGLKEPLFSDDRKILIYYPPSLQVNEYSVPDGVEVIGSYAFDDVKQLARVTFPQSLKHIQKDAFHFSSLQEVTIPKDVDIETAAFQNWRVPLKITREEPLAPLPERLEICRIKGSFLLTAAQVKVPGDKYWKTREFIILAKQCGNGSITAIDAMGDYFADKFINAKNNDDKTFYHCAENFWRVRAFRRNSKSGRAYLEKWAEEHPYDIFPSPFIRENLSGNVKGISMNALGFLFFDPDREYSLSGIDSQGVVEVCSYESEDGPDEDGFGYETYYDWWYLTDCLCLPAGVGYIHSYSTIDKRANKHRFKELYDRVAAVSRKVDER